LDFVLCAQFFVSPEEWNVYSYEQEGILHSFRSAMFRATISNATQRLLIESKTAPPHARQISGSDFKSDRHRTPKGVPISFLFIAINIPLLRSEDADCTNTGAQTKYKALNTIIRQSLWLIL
jgi:hypothetical protein